MKYDNQPVSQVMWVKRERLTANSYNPNSVAPPELKLLKQSIKEDGWTQPIVINPDFSIIDGFHRWTVSADPEISEMTDGHVPVVLLTIDRNQRMMSTIRHNRARGTHGVLHMAKIVEELHNNGCSQEEIMKRVGMEKEEVKRLLSKMDLPDKVSEENPKYKSSWKPDAD